MNPLHHIQIKVCGLRDHDNICELARLPVQSLGFIFHPSSPRFVGEGFVPPSGLGDKELVGVFVDENPDKLLRMAKRANLHTLQLHGNESPAFCRELRQQGFRVWKSVAVKDRSDLHVVRDYEGSVDAILLDTKASLAGGNGLAFDWDLLQNYEGHLPFYLAGGISLSSLPRLQELVHPKWLGIDLNSRFETAPGLKDVALLHRFISLFTLQEIPS